MLYISTSVWMLHTPNTVQNMLFQFFFAKKHNKKETKNEAKNLFLGLALVKGLIPEKISFITLSISIISFNN